ncbi:Kelch repeat-containing protein [Catellatospora vulcania]|uniref:hypothetical protein n=1 Tax=Catellatospora vulcania TaxID=1460450 RepID=UPI0012D45BEF|nr:hypothetical protein [Catellatospora vulcania]
MNKVLQHVVTAAAAATALVGGLALTASPAHAALPDYSCGTVVSADSTTATQLNGVLTGSLRNAMTAYRVSCARAIINTVRSRGLSERAAVIAITTSIVETTLRNNPNQEDHDSVGLFQQRASWGSFDQRMNPTWSTNAFLDAMLRKYPNNSWQSAQIGAVCQAVQVSAYPDRYQVQAPDAQKIVNALFAANRPVFEASSANGWQNLPTGITGSSGVAAMSINGTKYVYTLVNGSVYEASSANGWQNLPTGIGGASAVAAISVGTTKYLYTLVNGGVFEASSANGWQNLPTGVTGASALAAMSVNGAKYVYTVVNGSVFEASSANGWQNLPTGIGGASAVAAISVGTTKYLYTLVNGGVFEASSANGWQNLPTGVTGASALAAMSVNGAKYVYTVVNGGVFEASSANGWQNLPTGIGGASAVTAMSVGTTKYLYNS